MKITLGNAPVVLAEFMETVVMPKAEGWQKWAVGMGAVVATDKAVALVQSHKIKEWLEWLEVIGVSQDGFIEMDELRRIALNGMEKSGSFNFKGYIVDKADIEAIYEISKKLQAG